MSNRALRIIDANLNRCREGLRVIEDCLRFVLNDEILYKKVRRIRHNTDKILRDRYCDLIIQRDSFNDKGRQIKETSKKDLPSIITANFKRAQESLRTLEEYSKTFAPKICAEFKKQRYNAYNVEKAVFLKHKKSLYSSPLAGEDAAKRQVRGLAKSINREAQTRSVPRPLRERMSRSGR
ncbi:MAG: thiamine-phosphate pyrophosphorylase [Elusimicrobiota bacterium]|jgi:thiamine-phosphate pyrophosphorylase|nr:thiamine-phosphate pyrophosphorylase [Elusimicrobiota bacterium]